MSELMSNIFTQNPKKMEETLSMLQSSIQNNNLINKKVVFEWKKLGESPDKKYHGYQIEFTYEHQFGWANKLLFSQFMSRIQQIDPSARVKKIKG